MSKKSFFKTTLTATALLAASGYTVMAQARCVGIGDNFGASGITAASTSQFQSDTYVTVCPAGVGVTKMVARVSKKSGTLNHPITVEVGKGGFTHAFATDTTTTAATQCVGGAIDLGASATATVSGNAGQYTIIVSKDSAAMNYAMDFHCETAAGVEVDPVSQSGVIGLDSTADVDRIMNH
jgi:hypothetical protein